MPVLLLFVLVAAAAVLVYGLLAWERIVARQREQDLGTS